MSGVSWSGTLTLVMLWAIGPLIYLGKYLVERRNKPTGAPLLSDDADEGGDETPAEGNWTSAQYLFGLVGYAIGLGNVWRFCHVIAKDGGSAALFAYVVCTVFVATPLFLHEMILGQYLRLPAVSAWAYIRPRYGGLALSQLFMLLMVQSYYVMVLGYTVPYMLGSCLDPLPWTLHAAGSEGYWFENVLGLKESSGEELVEVNGLVMQWSLVGSLAFMWVVIFLSVSFGKNTLADITYVTVCLPVALMAILIIRMTTLPGAMDGISYYIGKFDGAKLLDSKVWANALSQCLFFLSPGFGTAVTMSSMADPHEDVYKVAVITSVANTAFAVASGFAVFAMVGNIALDTGRDLEDVASTGGQGLAFIVIASAMPTFGRAANALSAMFFFMLFTLGLDSAFCFQETLNGSVGKVLETYGGLAKGRWPATWVTSLISCSACFAVGLPYATNRGNIFLDGVDFFIGISFLLFVCFAENLVFNFNFGWTRLEYALQKATLGRRTLRPHHLCCRFDFHLAITIATFGLLVYQMGDVIRSPYLPDNPSVEAAGWVLFCICLALTFVGSWKPDEGQLAKLPVPADEYPWGVEYWAEAQVGGVDETNYCKFAAREIEMN